MGVLSISAPVSLESSLATRATLFGVSANTTHRDGATVYMYFTGDPLKCMHTTSIEGVKRLSWTEKTAITAEDRVKDVKRSRRQA